MLITLAVLSLPATTLAQADGSLGIEGYVFNERVQPSAEISGSVILGLVAQGNPTTPRPSLSAWIPVDWAGTEICARVRTIDGLYEADLEVDVGADWAGGILPLPFPTDETERLRDMMPGSVAVYVRHQGCRANEGPGSVAYWNVGADEGEPLLLLVNAFRADEVYVYAAGQEAQPPLSCTKAEGEALSAFDTICTIPRDRLESGTTELQVYRLRDAAFDPPVTAVFSFRGDG